MLRRLMILNFIKKYYSPTAAHRKSTLLLAREIEENFGDFPIWSSLVARR